MVFSSAVYQAGNANAPKIVYLPPLRPTFCRGSSFCIKTKLKFEIFKDKKSWKRKMFLSVLTKNLNLENLTKNLVTFNFIMCIHWEICIF